MLDLNYEQGLNQVKNLVLRQTPESLPEFSLLQMRLAECLNQRRYGEDPGNRATLNRILEQLIHFTYEHFGLGFIDLCQTDTSIQNPVEALQQQSSDQAQHLALPIRWEGGSEVTVQGIHYIIHEPVTTAGTSDRSALYLRAKAQQVDANRIVWLKQIQRHRTSAASAAWTKALEKEGQLLQALEQEDHRGFPREVAFEQALHTTTLIHTASSGQSWLQTFGQMETPLNAQLTQILLQSAISLGYVLKELHRKGLAHRALCPDTILLLHGTQTSVQDIGLATRKYEPGEGIEMYRAPEQRLSNRQIAIPGAYTDVYQLGMMLYRFITAHVPASSEHVVSTRTWNASISPALDAVLLRAIATDTKYRWKTTSEFSNALRQVRTQQ